VQVLVKGQAEVVEGVLVDGVRTFDISAEQWSFGPTALKVEPGDKVRFTVTSDDIMHGFSINELGINLALSPDVGVVHDGVIPLDMSDGTYTMYCSIFCGIGHPYMKGSIIIGEPGFEMGKILPYIATTIMAGMFATFVVIGRRRAR
jgi:cytochrome c oxidase subunit 2